MKKLIAIGAMALVMTTCSTPSSGAAVKADSLTYVSQPAKETIMDLLVEERVRQTAMEAERNRLAIIASNTEQLNNVISQLKGQIGKTWYVFSGATPSGWDCSGMVMWAYGQLGYNLEHRASKQKHSGEFVTEPKVGDIVAFSYHGSDSAYHVGIWLSPDTMIHAGGQKGEATEIIPISSYSGNHSTVTFTRILETN